MQAIDLENGQRLWEAETKAEISAGPGVGDGLVIVGTRNAEILAFISRHTGWQMSN